MNENDLRRIDQIIEAVHLINGRITGLIDTMKKKTVHNDKISLGKLLSDILGILNCGVRSSFVSLRTETSLSAGMSDC